LTLNYKNLDNWSPFYLSTYWDQGPVVVDIPGS